MANLPSPIDGAPMRKVERYGVELDVCVRSGGVWLDKGELERIVSFAREDAEDHARRHGPRDYHDDYEEEDDFDDDNRRNRKGGRKRSRLFDIFDF